MCVDFTDLNKAVDATSGHELLMDTYSGYNQIKMKLNPTKCTFGVREGMFLGYIINQRDVETNPDKIKPLLGLRSPTTKEEVQRSDT